MSWLHFLSDCELSVGDSESHGYTVPSLRAKVGLRLVHIELREKKPQALLLGRKARDDMPKDEDQIWSVLIGQM